MDGKELHKNLTNYLNHVESVKDTLVMTSVLLRPHQKKAKEDFEEFFDKNIEEIEDENGEKSLSIPTGQARIFERLSKSSHTSMLANKVLPESLFVALISQYDAFLNRLLKALFEIRPEYINNSDRELTYAQLIEFNNVEDARNYIVEKEIESVLRKSHGEQFDYLESKLSMPLRKKLNIWQTFIEITQRRNLYVHSDGIVTNQYLKVCSENKCDIKGLKAGKKLVVDSEYFMNAYECLFELAVKLTHTIWRKLLPDDLKNADRRLNDICYELMNERQFKLADELLCFACEQKKHFNDALKNVYVVNRALSQYLQGNDEGAKSIINIKDWSASSDDFKLAHLVITEDYKACYSLMEKIGDNGEVDKENYKTWPLFSKIREEKKFKATFKKIFGEDYAILEIPKKPVQELIIDIMKNNPKMKKKTVKKVLSDKQKQERKEEE